LLRLLLVELVDKPAIVEILDPVQIPQRQRVQAPRFGKLNGCDLVAVGDRLRRRVGRFFKPLKTESKRRLSSEFVVTPRHLTDDKNDRQAVIVTVSEG
jgi:hypothetical protein